MSEDLDEELEQLKLMVLEDQLRSSRSKAKDAPLTLTLNQRYAKAKKVRKKGGGSTYKTSPWKYDKRIRPWQREGFSSKKEWSLMRKRINNLIWKNREVA